MARRKPAVAPQEDIKDTLLSLNPGEAIELPSFIVGLPGKVVATVIARAPAMVTFDASLYGIHVGRLYFDAKSLTKPFVMEAST